MADSDQTDTDRKAASPTGASSANVELEGRGRGRSMKSLAMLWPYARRHPRTLVMVAVFLVAGVVTSLAIPLLFREVVDAGFGTDLPESELLARIDSNFAILFAFAVGIGVLSATRMWFVSRFGERVGADLRSDIYEKLLALSPNYHTGMRSGEAVSRLTADITLIQTFMTSSASLAVRTLLNTVGALAMMLWVNATLGGALLLVIPVAILPMLFIGRRVRKLSTETQTALADAGAEAAETLDAIELVQAYGREPSRWRRFRRAVEDTYRKAMTLTTARAAMIVVATLLFFGGVVLILWLGARMVARETMSPGDLSALVLYALYASSGFGMLAEVYGEVMRAAGAADRAEEVLKAEIEITNPPPPMEVALPDARVASLVFDDVCYAYPGSQDNALTGVDLTVRPGEFVAIVGPSGAGKSTLFRLLLRFTDPDWGEVRLGEADASLVRLDLWRSHFAFVPQEAQLFTGSVRENMEVARHGLSDEDMVTALKMAEAWDFVAEKGGLDADLGKLGRSLSGGQRQRLALARAFAKDAPVLLLDEATSALDSESEAAIQSALENAASRFTIIAIAHRLATVRQADRILVLDEGRVVEQGDHDQLVARDGLYARLARLQFTDVKKTAETA